MHARLKDVRLAAALAGVAVAMSLAAAPAGAVPQRTTLEGLFDVGGHSLYLRCSGHGSPTVVMDASLGATSATWAPVEPAISRYTRTCVYDRAGLGLSQPGRALTTSQTMVDELETLLAVAGEEGPYVLVGHSLGGLNMQLFARQDGGESVVGVVFVDATPAQFVDVLDSFGVPIPTPEQLPEPIDLRASAAQVLAAPAFPAVPLVVLTHGLQVLPQPLDDIWQDLQAAHAELSPLGQLVVAEESHHFIQHDEPELVIRSVIQVVKDGRVRGPGYDRGVGSLS